VEIDRSSTLLLACCIDVESDVWSAGVFSFRRSRASELIWWSGHNAVFTTIETRCAFALLVYSLDIVAAVSATLTRSSVL